MDIRLNVETPIDTKIKILGVGGAGGNAINSMINSKIQGVEFMVANTDAQDLKKSLATTRINLGAKITRGLGAGADPEKGRLAAIDTVDEIGDAIGDANMLFIAAGMGGGTGTGAAPVIARKAKDMGVLTLGIVSLPFDFEGKKRRENAALGIREIQDVVDTLIVIPNNKISKQYGKLSFLEAFKKADEIITNAANAIADIINRSGYMNVDFADVKTVMSNGGYALMGTGVAEGEDRAKKAAEQALRNQLLADVELTGCKALLVNVAAGPDMMMDEFDEINETITSITGKSGTIISGMTLDETLTGCIKVTIIATGLSPSDAIFGLFDGEIIPPKVSPQTQPEPIVMPRTEPITIVIPDQTNELDDALKRIKQQQQDQGLRLITPTQQHTALNEETRETKTPTMSLSNTEFKQGEPPAFMKKYFN